MLKLNHRSPETVLIRETPNIPRICRVIYVPRQKWFQQIAIRTPHTFCPRPNWPGQHLSAIIKFITSVRLFSGCLKWGDTQFARTAIFWQSEAAAQIDTHLGSWGRFSWSQVKWVRKPDCFSTGGEMRRMFEMCRVQVEGKWCSSSWWRARRELVAIRLIGGGVVIDPGISPLPPLLIIHRIAPRAEQDAPAVCSSRRSRCRHPLVCDRRTIDSSTRLSYSRLSEARSPRQMAGSRPNDQRRMETSLTFIIADSTINR